MVAVTGLMTTDTLYFHFTILFKLASGAVLMEQEHTSKTESLQYWHI
jgi:hypothetical protein